MKTCMIFTPQQAILRTRSFNQTKEDEERDTRHPLRNEAFKVLVGKSDLERPFGRPRCTLQDNVFEK